MDVDRTVFARRSLLSRVQRGRSRGARGNVWATAAGVIAANTQQWWEM